MQRVPDFLTRFTVLLSAAVSFTFAMIRQRRLATGELAG